MSGGPSSRIPCKASVRASMAEKSSSSSMILESAEGQPLPYGKLPSRGKAAFIGLEKVRLTYSGTAGVTIAHEV